MNEDRRPSEDRLRIDKWLWYGRFFKSRSLATRQCEAGRIRLNRTIVTKAHATVDRMADWTRRFYDDILAEADS